MKKTAIFALSAAMVLYATALDVGFLRELVAIPSVSTDVPQVNRAMRTMKDYLEKRGVWCVLEKHQQGCEVLFAATKADKRQDFVISIHLDVVPAVRKDQFELKKRDGKLFGRGTDDCKGRAVAVADLLVRLNGKASVGCIFGGDEETCGITTSWMVDEMGYAPRRMAIVPDAGPARIYYAQKGQCMVRLSARGRSGHSSMPWVCDDSITRLVRGYLKIREVWDKRYPPTADRWWNVLTPTVVRSEGEALNRIPGEAGMVLNLRSTSLGAKDELLALVREVSDLDAELLHYSPPVSTDPGQPLVRGLRKAMAEVHGREIPLSRMVAACDARCFVTCGVAIAIVGSNGGGAHGDNEWADPESIDTMEECLIRFLSAPDKYAASAAVQKVVEPSVVEKK